MRKILDKTLNEGISLQRKAKDPEVLDAEIGFRVDDDFNGYVTVLCPKCSRTIEAPIRGISPGDHLDCECGDFAVELGGDDLRDLQESLDSLRRSFQELNQKLTIRL